MKTNENMETPKEEKSISHAGKVAIVRKCLGSEYFPADRAYVGEFESRFGALDYPNFLKHFDDTDFTAWAIESGY